MSDEFDESNGHEPTQMLDLVPVNTLGALVRAEIDTQIATAKSYPRSIAQFRRTALAMATLDEEVASSCFYAVPRAGKSVEGPSVRLAEIVGSAWGNVRYGARVIADDGKIITAQGVCSDLERNVSATVEVQRRVTGRNGKRFNDDMVVMTGNAACAIALRNAIFRVIPMTYVKDIYREARRVAIGDAKTLANKRADMLLYFGKMGVPEDRVLAAIGKTAVEDVGLSELATLKGIATAIKDSETTVDEAFPVLKAVEAPTPDAGKGTRSEQVAQSLAAKTEHKEEKKGDHPGKRQASAINAHFQRLDWVTDQISEYLDHFGAQTVEGLTYEQAELVIRDLAEKQKAAPAK